MSKQAPSSRISGGSGDSEVIFVNDDAVFYRVDDAIFERDIHGSSSARPSSLLKAAASRKYIGHSLIDLGNLGGQEGTLDSIVFGWLSGSVHGDVPFLQVFAGARLGRVAAICVCKDRGREDFASELVPCGQIGQFLVEKLAPLVSQPFLIALPRFSKPELPSVIPEKTVPRCDQIVGILQGAVIEPVHIPNANSELQYRPGSSGTPRDSDRAGRRKDRRSISW